MECHWLRAILLPLLSAFLAAAQVDSNCSWTSPDGSYQIEWEFDPQTLLVTFGIDARHRYLANGGQDMWTGLMIGNTMSVGDFLLVDVLKNAQSGAWDVRFRDMQSGGGRSSPIPDGPGQDHIVNGEGRVVDGRIYARFARPLQTSDRGDNSLAECDVVLRFPVSGGQLFRNGQQLFVGKHTSTPDSKKGVCVTRDCVRPQPKPVTTPPPPPPRTRKPPPPPRTQPPRPQREEMPELRCSPGQTDHSSCFGYLEEYFQNVTNWAEQNAFEPATQFPRACRLLVEAQNGLIKAVCCRNLSERFCRRQPFN